MNLLFFFYVFLTLICDDFLFLYDIFDFQILLFFRACVLEVRVYCVEETVIVLLQQAGRWAGSSSRLGTAAAVAAGSRLVVDQVAVEARFVSSSGSVAGSRQAAGSQAAGREAVGQFLD
jgi:hypothetical protein